MEKHKKKERYQRLYLQVEELLKKTDDETARMSTIAAVLYNKLDYFFWCGFYRLVNGQLLVGPYQGPLACQILEQNKGVCWAAVNEKRTMVVPDVHLFPGHIACDSRSQSEIVVICKNKAGLINAVLDVDSRQLAAFDEVDAQGLEKIIELL